MTLHKFDNQKGLIPILILLASVGALVFLVVASTSPFSTGMFSRLFTRPESQAMFDPGNPKHCLADSLNAFKNCINNVNANKTDYVEVTDFFICKKADNCEFRLANIRRPVMISGKKGVKAGIKRLDWFQNPILHISASENIYIGNLIFDENDEVNCETFSDAWVDWTNPRATPHPFDRNTCAPANCLNPNEAFLPRYIKPCQPTIAVGGDADNIVFDNIQVLYFKHIGLYVYTGNGHNKIMNSLFKSTEKLDPNGRPKGSGSFGLGIEASQFELINNKFINIQSGAAGLASNAKPTKHSVIKGNLFKNAGSIDLVNSSGGIWGFYPGVTYTDILYNETVTGKQAVNRNLPEADPKKYKVNGGIEVDTIKEHLPDNQVNFIGNVIHDIEGLYGIGVGNKPYFSDFVIAKNVIYDIRPPAGYTAKPIDIQAEGKNILITNNCLDNPGCKIPAYTTITAFPDQCLLKQNDKCISTLRWSSKGYSKITIKNKATGAVLKEGTNGETELSWTMTPDEQLVEILADNKVVSNLVVREGKLVEEIAYKGNIAAKPNTCKVNADGLCTVRVEWDVSPLYHDGIKAEVRLDGAPYKSGGVIGSVDVPYISVKGLRIELYVDGELYDALTVKGETGTSSKTPSLVFVMTGESNAGGIASNSEATPEELAPNSSLKILNNNTLKFEELDIGKNNLIDHAGLTDNTAKVNTDLHGLELQLANSIKNKAFPNNSLSYLVKTGQGFSYLADWNQKGTYWSKFLQRTTAAKNQLPPPVQWVVWYSLGINDIIGKSPVDRFKTNTTNHIRKIQEALPGAIILLSQFQSIKFDPSYNLALYNAALAEIAIAEPNVYVVNTAGASLTNDKHWNYQGYKTVASRMVDITSLALNQIKNPITLNTSAVITPYKGNISVTPKNCKVSAVGLCTVKMNWDVSNIYHDGIQVAVYIENTPFKSGGVTGSADVPWVNEKGIRMDLYVDGELYDTLTVKADK